MYWAVLLSGNPTSYLDPRPADRRIDRLGDPSYSSHAQSPRFPDELVPLEGRSQVLLARCGIGMGIDRRRGLRSRAIQPFRPDATGSWPDHWPALLSSRKNLSLAAILLDWRRHGHRSACFTSDTLRAHSQRRRLRFAWLNTLDNLLRHPLLSVFAVCRPQQIECTIDALTYDE